MQQNGAGETPNGDAGQLSISSAAGAVPTCSSLSRLRRLTQDGREVPPQPTVMVVFSAARDSEPERDSAMSKCEEEKRRVAINAPNRNLPRSLRTLNAPQEVHRPGLGFIYLLDINSACVCVRVFSATHVCCLFSSLIATCQCFDAPAVFFPFT